MDSFSLQELAVRAKVDADYVSRLVEMGAVERRTGTRPYGPSDVRRVQLLQGWEAAGFPTDAVADLVRTGELSLAWLDAPGPARPPDARLNCGQLCEEEGVPLDLMQSVEAALGFPQVDHRDPIREGDRELMGLVKMLLATGVREASVMGLVRVYTDSLRRVAKAEAELYEREIEEPLRRGGRSEQELLHGGAPYSDHVIACLEEVLLNVYRRHREHVWIEHCVAHAEAAFERAGLHESVQRPPAICFVDLTGYTRITEERGDEIAAQLATDLASHVESISRIHGGRPIRWLGDGGMFHFKEAGAAVMSGLDMVEGASQAGLPQMHIGIHTGSVIFQDGDVYGKTVNLASRIASYAGAGHVLASDETVARAADQGLRFERLGPVRLKGIARPVTLHRALRNSAA